AKRLHPDAGIGAGRRGHRHQGAVRQHWAQARHRLRHGRHHRKSWRDPRRRGVDDRRRADRWLCHRAAGADSNDRYPGGRHRRRLDPADCTLVAYGGAGPLHAAMVARELRIAKVVIPRAPGHFSAYGMLVADLRRDFVKTWFMPLAEASFAAMEAIYAEMERHG